MKATRKMTAEELAKVFAEHFGYAGRPGGWIYDPQGVNVAHGWAPFAELLSQRGWIKTGEGINWRGAGERPRLPQAGHAGRERKERA